MTSLGGTDLVDWNLAVATATRFARPGPEVSREEARAIVAELRRHATASEEYVRDFTQLDTGARDTPVLVVDRPGWVKANVAGFRALLQPLMARMRERRAALPGGTALTAVGSKVTGVEVGMLLSFLSSRVLGQYETFAPATPGLPAGDGTGREDGGTGRLLLVAPNIVHVERELDVRPHDFRLWVCLHEETHRTQFTAVPWLRDHLESEVHAFLREADVDPATLLERFRQVAQSATGRQPDEARDQAREVAGEEGRSLVDLVRTPRQREILDRLTAVMSLLEGHADYVMDGVGPQVVPTVAEIREKFTQRRQQGAGRLDRALRRLLGMDAKLRQYRDGERFVRTVVESGASGAGGASGGMAGFNKVWTSPNTLPSMEEITKPEQWLARVRPNAA